MGPMPESTEPKTVAYFIRHGSTQLNDENRFRGPLNPPLDENGINDAHKASDFLSNVELGDAWSSDRDRAETTARAVLQPKGMSFESDPNLRSWNVGYMAGQKKSEMGDDISYFQRHTDQQIPNGESLDQFRDRVHPPILRALQSGVKTGKPSLVIAHSSVLKEVGNMLHGDHNHNNVDPGGIVAVTHDGQKFDSKAVLKARTKKNGYGA